ncbi:MAG: DUF4886 domain-containing protein [Oscillospiraceae bacterium]|nr:DUF4886 domain-containing protein [Oscillospiraceae bacterium]
MKKLIALCLALLMLVSALPLAGAAFKDEGFIDEAFAKAVAAMSEQGIINGFEDGSFGPKKTLTRAQAAKIICVMLEGAEKANALTKTETGFSDVPATHWAAKFVAYCVDKGIVAGVGDGKFDPNGQLSSAAFAKMLLVAYGTDGSTFTGAEWLQNVQAAAEKTFLLYNQGDKVTTGSMERQKAAQMAFSAMFQAEANADKAKGDPRTMPVEVPEKMKLFVIGNSYGNDCSIASLYEILKDLGVKDLVIGVLYYSGCPYMKHVDFFLQDKPVYKYYKNETGKFKTQTKVTFNKAIMDEEWTHIMMLHGFMGHEKDFAPVPWQDLVLSYVQRLHPNAYLGYVMTWTFREDMKISDSHKKSLDTYHNGDRMAMWEGQIKMAKTYAEPEQRFKFIVPAGAAVMNAHSSFLGDGVHRDSSSHLNKGVGRYIAAMTVACTLTGAKPEQIKYTPDFTKNLPAGLTADTPNLAAALEKVAKESVTNALAKPYEITQSAYKTIQ